MATPSSKQLQDQIDWTFTVAEQGHVARYGTFGGEFYKQVLPAGVDVPGRFPPRRIPAAVYNFSKRVALTE